MADTFDAAARLADGSPGVADIQQYVLACQCLGYQHPDLTAHPAQIHDWYATEEGMDLGALEADCVALRAAAAAVADALARQDAQLGALTAAWQGDGANASREFLRRHGEASTRAATTVRTAAQALDDLRDRLWRAVDGKVGSVLSIGDGVQGRRADWLAASQTVTTGAGDRAVASELVDQEVKPFVDNVIGGEWLAAMRAAVDAVEAAYEAATAELGTQADATFDVPGELGPAWTPSTPVDGVVTTAPAGTVTTAPASSGPLAVPGPWGGPSVAAPPAGVPAPVAAPPSTDPAVSQPAAVPSLPSLPSLGGRSPDIGSGLSGFGQQLGDMLGGLVGDSALGDSMEVDDPPGAGEAELDAADGGEDPDIDEPGETDDEADELTEEDEGTEEKPEDPAGPAAAEGPCPPEALSAGGDDVSADEPAPTPPPEPLAATSAAPPAPPAEGPKPVTPCEIAANELPQVGE